MVSRRLALTAALCCAAAGASAQERVTPAPSPPPIAGIPNPPWQNGGMLVDFVPGQVQCADGPVVPLAIERPLPVHAQGTPGAPGISVTVAFRIDADGRPLGIVQQPSAQPGPRLYHSTEDVLPAFVVWRFAAGRPRASCRVTFEAKAFAGGEAPLPLVRRFIVAPHTRMPGERALFRRLHPEDTNCIGGNSPKLRLRAFPDFDAIPQAPGSWAYSMTSFDIDRRGRPVNVRVSGSDGSPVLDRAAVAAVKRSRYAPEARRGCTFSYYRQPVEPVEAPPAPDKAGFAPADAPCPEGEWKTMPRLRFPEGFARRRIEGWAVIGYDVAPWGATGNVRVLAAEPAAAFGEQGRGIVSAATQASSATGKTGCVDLVRFVMPKAAEEGPEVIE